MPETTISSAEAARTLNLDPHSIAKLLDAGVLVGPPPANGRRKGVYAGCVQTARAVLPTTLNPGDLAFHIGPLTTDEIHHDGRSHAGWHQHESLNELSPDMRRLAWTGVWNINREGADRYHRAHAMAAISGFIVDVAKITGNHLCSCGCGLVVFDVTTPDDHAVSRYRGRRIHVPRGSLWTTG